MMDEAITDIGGTPRVSGGVSGCLKYTHAGNSHVYILNLCANKKCTIDLKLNDPCNEQYTKLNHVSLLFVFFLLNGSAVFILMKITPCD